jgi:LmbE family N-acetylglucosaminyl deacetylase
MTTLRLCAPIVVLIALTSAPTPQSWSEGAEIAEPPRYVQVVAHPDDDMIFMNPDVSSSVRAGSTTTSVYLSAGESDAANPTAYAAQRQEGTRAAFAAMARVANRWERRAWTLEGGRTVELARLRDKPGVRLVFLNLPDDNDPHAIGGKHALRRLWEGRARVRTLVPDGSPQRNTETYARHEVVEALADIFRACSPTLVRTQDPAPDTRYQQHWGVHHDHPDHVMTAHFTRAAQIVAQPGRRVLTVHYRDYNTADAPPTLGTDVVASKRHVFRQYARHDPMVGLGEPYATWLASMRYRWPRSAQWASRDRTGRLHTALVVGQRLVVTSGADENVVATPEFVPLEGSPVLIPDAGGDLVLVVQAERTGEIWCSRQNAPKSWARWGHLGRPEPAASEADVGLPSAVVDGEGRLVVVVRNGRGGVSLRRARNDGRDPRWLDIGGADVQDRPSAFRGVTGTVGFAAPSSAGLLLWQQKALMPGTTPTTIPYLPAGEVAFARGTVESFAAFRDARTHQLVVLSDDGNGIWKVKTTFSAGGSAPALSVVRQGDRDVPVLAVRDDQGRAEVVHFDRRRVVLRGPIIDRPAFTPDGRSLVAVSDMGRLLVSDVDISASVPDLNVTGAVTSWREVDG